MVVYFDLLYLIIKIKGKENLILIINSFLQNNKSKQNKKLSWFKYCHDT